MATYAERFKIERDSRIEPDGIIGSPPEIPSDTTVAEIQAAVVLRKRIRSTVMDLATEIIAANAVSIPTSGIERDKIAWARLVVASPDAAAEQMLRVLLAHFDAFSAAQILDPGITDQTIHDAIEILIPALALGHDVRR
jgi:hypothetical protein